MSSAIQQVLFPFHESPRPLIHYVGPNQLEQNTSTIKTNALYAHSQTIVHTVDCNKLQQDVSTAQPEHFHRQDLSQSSNTTFAASKALWVVGSSPVATPPVLDLGFWV
jgi:hypothetical protein